MQITVEKIMVLWYTILLHKQKTGRKEGDTVPEKSFDVARNIRMTQELQCQMLAQVADLFTAMHNNASKAEQTELLAKLEISLRLLAGQLGISQDGLSRKAAMTLKATLVQEDVSAWKSDLLTVLHELEET